MLIRRSDFFCEKINFASIDIGRKNFAVVYGECNVKYENIKYISFELINFDNIMKRIGVQKYINFYDTLKNYFETHKKSFIKCDLIFVEYQPPSGMSFIHEFLQSKYVNRVRLVHPKSVQKFFKISNFNYNERKIAIEYYSYQLISLDFFFKLSKLTRKHDVCDAICLSYYFIQTNK